MASGLFPDVHGGRFSEGILLKPAWNGFPERCLRLCSMCRHLTGMISLVVDGIVAGVGGILTFLPNIFILFLALAFLEVQRIHMARVAYVAMNEIMGRWDSPARLFCRCPWALAVRFLPSWHPVKSATEQDRPHHFITPFMSCSARLPIYVLFQRCFQRACHAAAYSLYVIGLLVAITIAFILHKQEKIRIRTSLLIELPEYKTPNARTVAIYVWGQGEGLSDQSRNHHFVASIVLWFVLNFGVHGYETDVDPELLRRPWDDFWFRS